ncbi:hypothetical protein F4780DRAFT_722368 [Xylariomycetidae sp. FL0641]|nr:hypothetical protein F4780DRAFT_722368 [Xylariomycetidae sp. FL0641]
MPIMSCSCRSTSLHMFVQSLTDIRLSTSVAARSSRRIDPRFSTVVGGRLSTPYRSLPLRSFTTASALHYPRLGLRGKSAAALAHRSDLLHPPHTAAESARLSLNDQTTLESSTPQEEALPSLNSPPESEDFDWDQARSSGAVLDFSPEAIDSLAENLEQASVEDIEETSVEDIEETSVEVPEETYAWGRARSRARSRDRTFAEEPAIDDVPNIKRHSKPRFEEGPRKSGKDGKDKQTRDKKRKPIDKRPLWAIQKEALKAKFPEGWKPLKRLSPDALDGIRALHEQYPNYYTTPVLSEQFGLSAEAIRRMLRSRWRPTAEEEERRHERWFNRGKQIWSTKAELGTKPPRKWRREGIVRDPKWNKPRGPRTEWPYVPEHMDPKFQKEQEEKSSSQRKLSGNLF